MSTNDVRTRTLRFSSLPKRGNEHIKCEKNCPAWESEMLAFPVARLWPCAATNPTNIFRGQNCNIDKFTVFTTLFCILLSYHNVSAWIFLELWVSKNIVTFVEVLNVVFTVLQNLVPACKILVRNYIFTYKCEKWLLTNACLRLRSIGFYDDVVWNCYIYLYQVTCENFFNLVEHKCKIDRSFCIYTYICNVNKKIY